jgi:hypothetical protein
MLELVEREVEGWRTLSLRVLGILEDLVDHEPCVGVFLELQSELAGKRLSMEELATDLVESGLGLFLLLERWLAWARRWHVMCMAYLLSVTAVEGLDSGVQLLY